MHSDKSALERLSAAMTPDDLSHKPRACDVDYVGALGMAGTHNRQGAGAAYEAFKATVELVRHIGQRRAWVLTPIKVRRIAEGALRHYLKPACGCCKGRGMLGLDRDQVGKAERVRPCDKCGGTGRAPLPVKNQREIREVLYLMEQRRQTVGQRVRRKMRVRAEVE
ncbi:hypothetical protein dqs_2027 [Azoarcus olearius]|uniref:hypothetical protein n=1 Tax=Azoarcus sp. (strain BH72) TaxID=418699 RepID=UPI0008062FDE|nr:hypothetical protein [Azoarcus olearius]ANQ85064.1 hypothetical protein dqs_2027 [Azoarcus olearius]